LPSGWARMTSNSLYTGTVRRLTPYRISEDYYR
jgi:hypothetical protein